MALDAGFGFYTDAALTIPISDITFVQAVDDSLPLTNKRVFLGNPDGAFTYQASSGPGVDQITVSISDLDPGNDLEATDIKLALTEFDLGAATPGDSLDVGLEIFSGAGQGVEIWITIIDVDLVQGTYTVQLETNELAEF